MSLVHQCECKKLLNAPLPWDSISSQRGYVGLDDNTLRRETGQSWNCQVLVVDDSPVYRKLIEQALEMAGVYSVSLAESAEEALNFLQRHSPPIIITDWMMPGLSGVDLCAWIRGSPSHRYSYVIVLTTKTEKASVVTALDSGADDYLTKPFDAGELLARVGVGWRKFQQHRDIEAKYRHLEELANSDALTGLPNRRAVEQWTSRQLRGAARHGFPLWVVIADLDSFKKVNDTYGHEAGDTVLRQFAEVLKTHTRVSDICGRMGGDEFLLVITHVNREQIQIAVERMRKQFVDSAFSFAGRNEIIGASFGISGFQGKDAPAFQTLVQQADRALYCAKRAGGNQLQIAG